MVRTAILAAVNTLLNRQSGSQPDKVRTWHGYSYQPPPAHRKTENKQAQGWHVLRIYRLKECLQLGQQGSAIHCTSQQEDTDSRRSTVYGEATLLSLL